MSARVVEPLARLQQVYTAAWVWHGRQMMTLKTRTAGIGRLGTARADALVFRLDEVRCALALDSVVEVVRAVLISPLPTAPTLVEGIIDVRGAIVPVLDLRGRLGLPRAEVRPDQLLVLADAGGRPAAVRVDAVEWIVPLDEAEWTKPEQIARGVGYLSGVGRTRDGLVLVHDLAAFLEQGETEALEAALAQRERTARPT